MSVTEVSPERTGIIATGAPDAQSLINTVKYRDDVDGRARKVS